MVALRDRFQELNDASSRDAAALAAQGKRATSWNLAVTPFLTFLRVYVWRGEYRNGVAGIVAAIFASYEVFVRYAKLWELCHIRPPTFPPSRP
jgi:hypothetical protein